MSKWRSPETTRYMICLSREKPGLEIKICCQHVDDNLRPGNGLNGLGRASRLRKRAMTDSGGTINI